MIVLTDRVFSPQKTAPLLMLIAVVFFLLPRQAQAESTLLDKVIGLNLGLNGYSIGKKLTPEQKKIAAAHREDDAHAGTIKFVDNDLHVIVDKESGRVLALYKRKEGVGKPELKNMIAELMDHFDAPTVMAHDKIIYWAYTRHGALSEEDFAKAKKVGQVPQLGIIATVKLNSDIEIAPDPQKTTSKDQESDAGNSDDQQGVIYFIITSDPLVKQFLDKRQEQ